MAGQLGNVEVVYPPALHRRTIVKEVLTNARTGLQRAGHKAMLVDALTPHADLVVIWGAGHPDVRKIMDDALGRGLHVIAWDCGYWERRTHYRCSFDAVHPHGSVMRNALPPDRLRRFHVKLRSEWDPAGPVLLVGMGVKCAQMYGEPVGQWENETAEKIRKQWPGRRIVFRPRPVGQGHCREVRGCRTAASGPIEVVLRGASLVVSRHSNVSVDAIVAGIPVVCSDGAAAAVCPRTIGEAGEPLPEAVRQQFLANLAWFNWSHDELRQPTTWRTIKGMLQ